MKDAREPDSAAPWRSPDLEIKIGISSCLLGETVRYDGGHQKDSYVTGALARHFTWVSVCPEMEPGWARPARPSASWERRRPRASWQPRPERT